MLGALIGALIFLVGYTMYQDHKVLWEIVKVLNQNQPKAVQSESQK